MTLAKGDKEPDRSRNREEAPKARYARKNSHTIASNPDDEAPKGNLRGGKSIFDASPDQSKLLPPGRQETDNSFDIHCGRTAHPDDLGYDRTVERLSQKEKAGSPKQERGLGEARRDASRFAA